MHGLKALLSIARLLAASRIASLTAAATTDNGFDTADDCDSLTPRFITTIHGLPHPSTSLFTLPKPHSSTTILPSESLNANISTTTSLPLLPDSNSLNKHIETLFAAALKKHNKRQIYGNRDPDIALPPYTLHDDEHDFRHLHTALFEWRFWFEAKAYYMKLTAQQLRANPSTPNTFDGFTQYWGIMCMGAHYNIVAKEIRHIMERLYFDQKICELEEQHRIDRVATGPPNGGDFDYHACFEGDCA